MQFFTMRDIELRRWSESQGMYGTPWSRQNKLQKRGTGELPHAASMVCGREFCPPMETLAQSVSNHRSHRDSMATIPLVCALAGNGTCSLMFLATSAIFARRLVA